MSAAELVRLAPSLVRYGAFTAWERALTAVAPWLAGVPSRAEAITPRWLTMALQRRWPGIVVDEVRCLGGSEGNTSRREIVVRYRPNGREVGTPTRFFCKATPRVKSRLTSCVIGKAAAEADFYNEFRPELNIEAATAVYAHHAPLSGKTLIILDDFAATRDCTFIPGPTTPIDRAKAESMVEVLAGYHGQFWNDPRIASRYRSVADYHRAINRHIAFEAHAATGFDIAKVRMPPGFAKDRDRLWSAYLRASELASRRPWTLIHTDTHIGNWYYTPEGRMGLSDWGMVRGHWSLDVAYALSSALAVADRRAWEQELLALYLDRLGRHGVAVPGWDEAWLAYRQQMFQGLLFWAFTLGAGAMQPKWHSAELCLGNLERMSHAIVDLDSVECVMSSA